MCGIHFTLSSVPFHDGLAGFMNDAFIANQVRGLDSAGMLRVSHPINQKGVMQRIYDVDKRALSATAFIANEKIANKIKGVGNSAVCLGHVRARTHGAVCDDNAHPFEAARISGDSEIVGVHNGSLNGWANMKEGERYTVDSEWMYNQIADHGIEAFKGFDGAYALVWYDSAEPEHIFIARNDKRPLFFAWTKDKKGVVGASELGMLGWLADRNKIELWADAEGRKFFHFGPNILYKMSLKNMEIVQTTELPKNYVYADNPFRKPVAVASRVGQGHPYLNNQRQGELVSRHDQDYTITQVRRVLTESKTKRTPAGDVVTANDATRERAEEGPQQVGADDLVDGGDIAAATKGSLHLEGIQPGKRLTYVEGMSVTGATTEEVKLAKELGYYGLLGQCWPYYHEEDEKVLMLSFSIGKKRPKEAAGFDHDCRIRNVDVKSVLDNGRFSDKAVEDSDFAVIGVQEQTAAHTGTIWPVLIVTPVMNGHRLVERRVVSGDIAKQAGNTVN